jgi:hypothetical protein
MAALNFAELKMKNGKLGSTVAHEAKASTETAERYSVLEIP